MVARIVIVLAVVLGCGGLLSAVVVAQEIQYKEYRKSNRYDELFRITFEKKTLTISLTENGVERSSSFLRAGIAHRDSLVYAGDQVIFDARGLILDGVRRDYDQILDSRVVDGDESISITFLTRPNNSPRVARLKLGNRITFAESIVVEDDEFVRGVVFSVTGSIEIYGEVNKDIVSLFGDVYIGPAAVARGDIASPSGRIDIARDASIYGETYSSQKKHRARKYRSHRRTDAFDLTTGGMIYYNRIDGFALGGEWRFDDPDFLLPSTWIRTGYAFASERWRFGLGLEQTIVRSPSLTVGGEYFRELASGDDWLLDDHENSLFVLLAKEDFKDYYEAEGGMAFVNFQPASSLRFTASYRCEETRWLDSHRNLWALFGGHKRFRENFSTVDSPFRDTGIVHLDTRTNGYLSTVLDFDTGNPEDRLEHSSWHLTGVAEWSTPDLSSDFDYRRYTLAARRYQRITRRSMVLLRAMYGGSDGELPMHKRFFLGGLGTLRGYDHKEYTGSRFWMANAEYRVRFPATDMAASLVWDVGRIDRAYDETEFGDVKHSLGIALHFGDDLRVNVSRRLDRSFDDDPKIYVRFEHVF